LRAELKEEAPNRIKVETEFNSTRGYKSVHAKIREQVLANKVRHTVHEIPEEKYQKVMTDDSTN